MVMSLSKGKPSTSNSNYCYFPTYTEKRVKNPTQERKSIVSREPSLLMSLVNVIQIDSFDQCIYANSFYSLRLFPIYYYYFMPKMLLNSQSYNAQSTITNFKMIPCISDFQCSQSHIFRSHLITLFYFPPKHDAMLNTRPLSCFLTFYKKNCVVSDDR